MNDSNTYKVVLPDSSERLINGKIIVVGDDGQMIIYNSNDPSYRNIEAVIPKTALVFIVIKSKV